jgi:hypothetical protein
MKKNEKQKAFAIKKNKFSLLLFYGWSWYFALER